MSSKRNPDLELERGIPTTPADVEALHALRLSRMSDEEYLRFLWAQPPPSYEELKARPCSCGEPFRLTE